MKLFEQVATDAVAAFTVRQHTPQQPVGESRRFDGHDSASTSSSPLHNSSSAFLDARNALTPSAVTMNLRCGKPSRPALPVSAFQRTSFLDSSRSSVV